MALTTLHANIKTFRTALYSYRANLFSSLGTMIKGIIPLNLVPKSHLRSILQEVVLRPASGRSRLTLAIPLHNILTYYDTPFIEEVDTSELGNDPKRYNFLSLMPRHSKCTKQPQYACLKEREIQVLCCTRQKQSISLYLTIEDILLRSQKKNWTIAWGHETMQSV